MKQYFWCKVYHQLISLLALYYILCIGLLSAVANLTSSEEGCGTLHITWTAPYTLLGVPINYYTINITRKSDGVMLRSDTTNTTEYLYTVSSLGETLVVLVAAVNDVGTGNSSNFTASYSLSSSMYNRSNFTASYSLSSSRYLK